MHGRALGLPERTFSAAGSKLRWNEWLTFSEKYSDLSADAAIEIRVHGSAGPHSSVLVGSAVAPLFDERQQLQEGEIKLRFQLAKEHLEAIGADGARMSSSEDEAEMERLEVIATRHEANLGSRSDLAWLDRPTYQLIEVSSSAANGCPTAER